MPDDDELFLVAPAAFLAGLGAAAVAATDIVLV